MGAVSSRGGVIAIPRGTCTGYVFVTPEYNHGTSGALKNAIDYLYAEWRSVSLEFKSCRQPAG